MLIKCIHCGGSCHEHGKEEYECDFCGAIFSKEEATLTLKKQVYVETSSFDNGVDVFNKNVNGVLEVMTSTSSGSGYLISNDGYAITNSHVVALDSGKPYHTCKVKVGGVVVAATIVAMGTENKAMHCTNSDLALLKLSRVPRNATPLQFARGEVKTGERIFVIGNSLGAGTCITSGIISDNNRNGQLMYDCPTNPGNSGGPVFNYKGEVIGTHVASLKPHDIAVQGMNFAIPTSAVKRFIDQVRRSRF